LLQKESSEANIFFLARDYRKDMSISNEMVDPEISVLYCRFPGQTETRKQSDNIFSKIVRKIRTTVLSIKMRASISYQSYRKAFSIKPDVVQASDVKEIPLALILKLFTGSRAVYDAHEDFFNFYYEFSGKSKTGLLQAIWFSALEWALIRFFDAVFCTDDYLLKKYDKPSYGLKKLHLLRNFANSDLVKTHCSYKGKNHLRIVYIGTVNRYRGIIEAADYIERFNKKFTGRFSLQLDIFSAAFPIVKELSAKEEVNYKGSLLYEPLMKKIAEYDVGLSLLLPIKKYRRNIPMKNFEYMSVGLPVLTSNFGQCKKYIDESGAGITIDPQSYEDFERAVLVLMNEEERKQFGLNGIKYSREKASFENEAKAYVGTMLKEQTV
jgi:glycosyltransferase involved in cell wall biosynthesis